MLQTNDFFTPLTNEREIITALEDWSRVCPKRTRNLNSLWLNMTFCAKLIRFQVSLALEVLGANPREEEVGIQLLGHSSFILLFILSCSPTKVFWLVLAAITNLGSIAAQLEESLGSHCDSIALTKVADLLGVDMCTLKMVLQRPNTPHPSPTSSSTPSSSQSRCSSPGAGGGPAPPEGPLFPLMLDNVRRLAVNLYSDLLSRLLKIINRSIKPDVPAPHSLILLDSPGLQGPTKQGDKSASGFSDLCYNYLQERLHLLLSPAPAPASQGLSLSLQRGGKIATSSPMSVPNSERRSVLTNLIDRTGPGEHSGSKTGSLGRRASRRVRFTGWQPGLLALLHRAASCPWSDDSTFVQRLLAHWQTPQCSLVEACGSGPQFLLHHLRGTCPVRYDASGWRLTAHNMGRTNLATELLRHTQRTELRQTGPPPLMSSSVGNPGSGNSLEEVRARMSCLQVRAQVDAVVRVVTSTSPHFVLCFLPHHLAGLSEILRADRECALNQRLLREQVGDQV